MAQRLPTKQSTLSEKDEIHIPIPPDGGFGWIVIIASFLCNFIIDGIVFSFGKLITSIMEELNISMVQAATISSIQMGTYFFVGPIVSAIVNKYGFRPVAIFGSLVSALGIGLTTLSKSRLVYEFCYGFMGGLGLGCIYSTSVVILGYYFEKYRAIASGIAMCGSCVGTIAWPPIFQLLNEKYGYIRVLEVQAGMVLCCSFFALCYRPLKYTKVTVAEDKTTLQFTHEDDEGQFIINPNQRRTSQTSTSISINTNKLLGSLNLFVKENNRICDKTNNPNRWQTFINKWCGYSHRSARPLYRKDIFYNQSIVTLLEYQGKDPNEWTAQDAIEYRLSMMYIPPRFSNDQSCWKRCLRSCIHGLGLLFDMSLLKSCRFLLIVSANVLWLFGLLPTYVYLTERMETAGLDKNTTLWILSFLSTGNAFGRLASGITSFFPRLDIIYLTTFATAFCGLINIISSFILIDNSAFQIACAIVFGFHVAFFNVLRFVIFVKYLGLEKLTNGFGLISFFAGFSALIATPISAAVEMATNSFDYVFILSGVSLIIAALLLLILKCF